MKAGSSGWAACTHAFHTWFINYVCTIVIYMLNRYAAHAHKLISGLM